MKASEPARRTRSLTSGRVRQRLVPAALFSGLAAGSLQASPARADTTLTVDLGTTLHPLVWK